MGAVNLAIVFGMGLAPNMSNPLGISPDLGLYQTMVKTWITHAEEVFPEIEDDQASSAMATSMVRAGSGDPSSEPTTPALEQVTSYSPAMSLEENSSQKSAA